MRSMARRLLASRSIALLRNATERIKLLEIAAPVAMQSRPMPSATRYSTMVKPVRRCLIYVLVSTITRDQCAHVSDSLQSARLPPQFHGHQAHVFAVKFGNWRQCDAN